MRVAAVTGTYLPEHSGGAEVVLHSLLGVLADAGHEVRVLLTPKIPRGPTEYAADRLPVTVVDRTAEGIGAVASAWRPDVLITQYPMVDQVRAVARSLSVPYVQLIHNTYTEAQRDLSLRPDLTVFNADWVAAFFAHLSLPSIVVHPPVDPNRHATEPGDLVTIVNLKRNKGPCVFWSLAERHPERGFLAVLGGYGRQILRDDLPNVEVQPFTTDMRADVWSRTRVLLAPSAYESYGLVVLEACCSGIPVIAHPTAGLREALGSAATFVDRDDIAGWDAALTRLDDPDTYAERSAASRARIAALESDTESKRWVAAVTSLMTDR